MNIPLISRLLGLAVGFTILEYSTSMAQADTNDPVVSAIQIISTTVNAGTNGIPNQSKQVFEGSASLNWRWGQAGGATNNNSIIQFMWYSPGTTWVTNSIYLNSSITSWPLGDTGTVTSTSFSWTAMTNSTTSASSVAAAYVPPTSNWQYAFGDVQVTTYPTYNPTGTNKVTKSANAILELNTKGGTNYGDVSLFKLTASATASITTVSTNGYYPYSYWLTTNTTSYAIAPGDIALSGLPTTNTPSANFSCGVGGIIYVGLQNNATYTIQPVLPAQYTNYTFNLSAQRIQITLAMNKGPGVVTQSDDTPNHTPWQGVGLWHYYRSQVYTNWGVDLGLSKNRNGSGDLTGYFNNIAEFTATIPAGLPGTGWKIQRDAQVKRYLWILAASTSTPIQSTDERTFGSAAPNSNDDSGGDHIPDSNGLILDVDGPALPYAALADKEPYSQVAMRFYAREWVSYNGVRISNLIRWHSFVTLIKTDLGISTIGKNALDYTPQLPGGGYDETPQFNLNSDGIPE